MYDQIAVAFTLHRLTRAVPFTPLRIILTAYLHS